ncbi:MAG: hypothetical protein H0U76_04415 [Ktedonobacteraceae bacterium]|nr:hypothetical protein [Ktedonobacteraceae bacterium]
MKLDMTHFFSDRADSQDLQSEATGEMELSSADLEIVCGGGSCPGRNGLYGGNPYQGAGYNYGGNPYQGAGYNYGGNPYQGAGYNYGGFQGNGYGNAFDQLPPCMTPPPPCPYSSSY